MLSSNGFCLAKTPLNDFWLVSNLKHRGQRELVASVKPFPRVERTALSICCFFRFLRVVFESFGNSWTLPVLNSSLSLKTYTSIPSPIGQDPFILYSF